MDVIGNRFGRLHTGTLWREDRQDDQAMMLTVLAALYVLGSIGIAALMVYALIKSWRE